MTIGVNEQSLKNKLNAANPNVVADGLRIIKFGDVLRSLPTFLRKKTPAASTQHLIVESAVILPDDAKASTVIRATARDVGTIAELTVVSYGSTPASGQIAVAPNGDIVTFAADTWLDLDVTYQPDKYDLAEITLQVVAGVLLLPAPLTTPGVVFLLEAEVTKVSAGSATGSKIVLIPDAVAGVGQARLNVAKTEVHFAVADFATEARVKVALVSATNLDALLTNVSGVA